MNIFGTGFIFTVALNVCLAFYIQMSEVQVYPRDIIILPCNRSGFSTEELHWEVMGKDVISLQGGNITAGQGYKDRVMFLTDPAVSEDFSLVLSDVMFNDGKIYECLWKGQKPICSVFVHVLKPLVSPTVAVLGEDVTLECFGNIPTTNPLEDIYIQWLKDDREVLRFSSGKVEVDDDSSMMSLPSEKDLCRGIFSLTISSVRASDQGLYQCLYKSTDYEAPESGFPETHTLTVYAVSSTTESIPSVSERSYTHSSRSMAVWTAVASTRSESSSRVSTHTYVEKTQTETISTSPAWTYAETVEEITDLLPVPEAALTSGQFEFLLGEEIPWIRIGLISGVLLLTAVVLGLLLVFGKFDTSRA